MDLIDDQHDLEQSKKPDVVLPKPEDNYYTDDDDDDDYGTGNETSNGQSRRIKGKKGKRFKKPQLKHNKKEMRKLITIHYWCIGQLEILA